MAKAALGVTRKSRWHTLEEGASSFWCVYYSYGLEPGDFIALYRPGFGIIQLHEIVVGEIDPEIDCNIRGMLTVPTVLRISVENPVTYHQFKENWILRRSGPLGRNFQATCFRLKEREWSEILKLLRDNNPDREDDLKRIFPDEWPD